MALKIPRSICVNLTYVCSKKCNYCDRLLDAFEMPDTNVTLEQVELFVKQVTENTDSLRVLKIAGGEATEHPQFLELIDILTPAARLANRRWVSTSYYEHEVPQLPRPWSYRSDPSEEGKVHHKPFMISPDDIGLSTTARCGFPWRCGVCFDYQGWSFCPIGTQIARVLDIDIFHKEPVAACNDISICKHCVYWMPNYKEIQDEAIQGKHKMPSKTFSDAIHKHRKARKLHKLEK